MLKVKILAGSGAPLLLTNPAHLRLVRYMCIHTKKALPEGSAFDIFGIYGPDG